MKEAGLLWSAWHKGLAVNDWRGQYSQTIDRNCPTCTTGARETVLHRLWECDVARKAWHWATHVLNLMASTDPHNSGPWRQFTWKQAIFSARILRRFRSFGFIWASIRGVVLWTLWLSRNDMVFNGIEWQDNKIYQKILIGLVNYGRVTWAKLQKRIKSERTLADQLRINFQSQWCRNNILATYLPLEDRIQWTLVGPIASYRPLFRVMYQFDLTNS